MNKAAKNIVFLLSVLALAALLYPTESDTHADGKTHVNYWYISGNKEEIPISAKLFNESQDSIVVDCTAIPWQENEKKVLTAILSGSPPDLVSMVSPVVKWASRMALTPLSKFMERDNFNKDIFFSALWEEVQYNNTPFALPTHSTSYALFYNKKIFQQAGLDPETPPRTWKELNEFAKILTLKNDEDDYTQMGFIPHYGNLQTSILMAYQLDAKFLSEDGSKVNLANPAMVKGLDWVVEFIEEYKLKKISKFMAGFGYADQHGFNSGKVAMMILDNSFVDQIKVYAPDLELGVAEIPIFEGMGNSSSAGCWWMAIPKGAKEKNAAWEFMKFAVKKDVQLYESLNMDESLFPGNKFAAMDSAYLNKNVHGDIFYKQMLNAKSPTIVPMVHEVFWKEFSLAREKVLHGVKKPKEALTQASKVIQKELAKAYSYDKYVREQTDILKEEN